MNKANLQLFTKKKKLDELELGLQSLFGKCFQIFNDTKYLEVILLMKTNWNKYLQYGGKKPFFVTKKGPRGEELKPHMVYWIY